MLAGPGGIQLAAGGSVALKANGGLRNLWGVLGERFDSVGRFAFAPSRVGAAQQEGGQD